LADTILLLSNSLSNSVLTGGSGVRNITKVYRLTYDVDFDTSETSIDPLYGAMRKANKMIGAVGSSLERFKTPGLITLKPGRNINVSFKGDRMIAPFVRWIDGARQLNIHIMRVPDMPEMFSEYEELRLETVVPVRAKVPTANRKHLFFRKARRALKEIRVEDFLDLTFLIRTSRGAQLGEMLNYCSAIDKKTMVTRGLDALVSNRVGFTAQAKSRLLYAGFTKPVAEWVEEAAADLERFAEELQRRG